MPRKNTSSPPPPVMTWKKASWMLVGCAIFDALRIMFEQFWFFGPALATAYCTIKTSDVVGTTVGGWLCSAAAVAAGTVGFAAIEVFGIVMAMATGLIGWLTIRVLLMIFNARIFAPQLGNLLWSIAGLGIAVTPLLGTVPSISLTVWRMYANQIKHDKKALAQYENEQAAARAQEQRLLALERAQLETVRQTQEAANEAVYEEAANDEPDREIPERVRGSA